MAAAVTVTDAIVALPFAYFMARVATARSQRLLFTAIMLPLASMMGYGIGYELDKNFGTHWLAITLMLAGTVGGFIQLIREITR